MKLYTESISDFKAWAGAVETWNALEQHGKIDVLESTLEEIYPDGMSETSLNDLLWFELELICEWVGLTLNQDTCEIFP